MLNYPRRLAACALLLLSLSSTTTLFAAAQDPGDGSGPLPSTWPQDYPNKPTGAYGPAWQKYFEVTAKLPNVTFPVGGRSFAGNLPVNRAGHPNNTLFFVGFEKSKGSLTVPLAPANVAPWGIWLNGGPGSSSLLGMLFENGPISIKGDYSAAPNPYAWNKLADYFWIDQPVGVGFSTADSDGYVFDEDQLGQDFMGFLSNLVKVFPSLATRPLHLTGESYAGQYIPYILKAYFSTPNPPVKIAKIAIGNGAYTSEQVFELLPALSVLETYPQIIGYDQDVYNYFKEQTHLCGFDVNLTYPQNGVIPDIPMHFPTGREFGFFASKEKGASKRRLTSKTFLMELKRRAEEMSPAVAAAMMKREDFLEDREERREMYKRDLSGRANGTIDPWYGCFLLDMFIDYALNFTFPWSLTDQPGFSFNVYNIPDALNPKVAQDASVWLNDPRTRAALHAPTVKDWEMNFDFTFGENGSNDPSPVAINIFNALAANATAKNIGVVLYSGNDDALIPHRGTELAIQNTTFGGIQGFTRQPATPWYNDAGKLAGVVHQERGWSYVLFLNSGHLVPLDAPLSAYTFLREFVLGNNKTGLVTTVKNKIVVLGGEVASLMGVIPGPDPIYYGNGKTQSSTVWSKATRTAWNAFMAKQTAAPTPTPTSTKKS